jgi:hypothetical protein
MKTLYTYKILFSVLLFQFSFAQEPYSGSGNWLELDGTNDYTIAPDHSSLDIGIGDGENFTIECFFYVPDLLDENLEGIILKETAYWLYINMNTASPDRILFFINGGSPTYIYTDVNLTVGWHHVAACYINNTGTSNDDMNLFLDGSRIAIYGPGTFYHSPGINNSSSSFYTGMYWTGVVNTFRGRIDEVRVSDILRYSGSTYVVPSSDFIDDGNTRALWHYNEVVGSTSFDDASTNNNTQTGQNGAQVLLVELAKIITDYQLMQNYPNPFNPRTSIQYAISSRQFVTLKAYDVLGNQIATIVNEEKPVGTYEINWNAANLPSGVYFYRIQAGSFVQTRKMILLK